MSTLATQAPAQMDEWAFLDREESGAAITVTGQPNPGTGEPHGFYFNMPFDEYAAVPARNGSRVMEMRNSPLKYLWHRDHPKPETDALKLGRLIHMLTLEPHLVGEFAIWTKEQGRRYGKAWDQFQADNRDRIILTEAEHATVVNTSTSALANAPIRKYAYAPGHTEVSAFWRCEYTGERMKARFDKMLTEEHCIVDLKSTRSCVPYLFAKQAWGFGWVHKMAHYAQGYKTLTGHEPRMVLLPIEKVEPCEGAAYQLDREHLLLALEEFLGFVRKIVECEKKGEWPPAVAEEQILQMPSYAFADVEDTELALEL